MRGHPGVLRHEATLTFYLIFLILSTRVNEQRQQSGSMSTMALEVALDSSHNAGIGMPMSTVHQHWLTWGLNKPHGEI